MGAMSAEELPPLSGHGDEGAMGVLMVTLDEATFVGVLPDGKTGT
jgi:hypothetical protein